MRTYRQSDTEDRKSRKSSVKKKSTYKEYINSIHRGLGWMLRGTGLCLIILIVAIIVINIKQGEDYELNILAQQDYSSSTIAARRGTITDRNGTILATSERIYTLILDPSVLLYSKSVNESASLNALVEVFGYDYNDLYDTVGTDDSRSYIRYRTGLTYDEVEAFEAYKEAYNNPTETSTTHSDKVTGIWFEESYKRVYPFETLACTLLGFSGIDDTRGNWGLEEYYNDELVGTDGRSYGYINTDGASERTVIDAVDGNTLVTTVDYTIQQACESAIADFLADRDADNVGIVVMNPNNGEILALATNQVYDLNTPKDLSYMYTDVEIAAMTEEQKKLALNNMWRNYAISDAYEPGSTAKPFTVAAALENCTITEYSDFDCDGGRTFGEGENAVTVKCNNTDGHGNLDVTEALMESCNCAMMDIAAGLGAERFSQYQSIFGFGRQTGIDLPGETAGLLYDASSMGVVDLATNAFGQNFNVNMIQMAAGFSSLVNGGYYYQPRVVKQILNSSGQVIENRDAILVRQTVTEETSSFIREALLKTVQDGTAKTAQISGYSIGGKTGTAEKLPRSDKKYLVSFMAVAPAEDPEILIYVVVDNPTVDTEEGESVSAKLAIALEKAVMESIIPYINLESRAQ